MEDPTSSNSTTSSRTDTIAQTLRQQRGELEAFLAAQRERLAGAEAKLTGQIQRIAQDLTEAQSEIQRTEQQQSSRGDLLALEAESIAGLKETLQTTQAEWRAAQDRTADRIHADQETLVHRLDELTERQTEIAEAEARLRHDEEKFSLARSRTEQENQELAQIRQTLETKLQELEADREKLAARRAQTEDQRQRIAHQLEDQRLAGRRELEQMRCQVDQLATDQLTELRQKLTDAEQQSQELASALTTRDRQIEEQTVQLEAARSRDSEWAVEQQQLRQQESNLREQLASVESELASRPVSQPTEDTESHEELQSERDALIERLTESQQRLSELQRQLDEVEAASTSNERDDYQDRYETAIKDLQEFEVQNEQLKKELSETRNGSATPTASLGNGLDWESRKQRLLATLEDLDEDDEEEAAERIEIEKVIQATDATIAAKDRELAELKRVLDQQSSLGELTVTRSAALDEMLDQDTIVQEERANLQRLQDELHEKLRHAEIDISIERADIARQQVEVEEIMRQFAEQVTPMDAAPQTAEESSGRRWLARLGLKKQEEEDS